MKTRKPRKWKDEHYVTVYELARSGASKQKIRKVLGVAAVTWSKWWDRRPALRDAFKRAHNSRRGVQTLSDYIYGKLPKKLRRIWKKLARYSRLKNGVERIEDLLKDQGKRARQHLWLHAYISSGFNASQACRMLSIARQVFEGWYKNDVEFHELFDGMLTVKKDYFEGALVTLVQDGDSSAIMFVNRTLNADRGYGTKVQLEHTGQIEHKVNVVPIRDLDLELQLKKALLVAIRERNEKLDDEPLKLNGHVNGNGKL